MKKGVQFPLEGIHGVVFSAVRVHTSQEQAESSVNTDEVAVRETTSNPSFGYLESHWKGYKVRVRRSSKHFI